MRHHRELLLLVACLSCLRATLAKEHPPGEETEECEVYVENDLRLAGASPDAGRVEIYHDGKWGTLCGKPSITIAQVLCPQLGFGRAIGIFTIDPKTPTPNHFSDIDCQGSETSIFQCGHSAWGKGSGCSSSSPPIAVRCEAAGLENVESIPLDQLVLPGLDARKALIPYHPQSKGGCGDMASPVMSPFSQNETEAFVYKDKLPSWLQQRTERLNEVMCRSPSSNPEAINSLHKDGLHWNQFGFDFSGAGSSSPVLGRDLLFQPRAQVLRDAYLSNNAKIFWSLDHEHRYPKELEPMSPAAEAIFKNLSRDGFVRIDDFGLDMDELDKTANWALSQRKQKNITVVLDDGACVMARPPIPALEPLLSNQTVNQAIRGYLGQDSVMHGYKILRLSKRMKGADNYIAADWHHDRAGRRLKLFVFLHDVANEGGRPTEVANGTHNLVYYEFEQYATSRYDDKFIQDNFDIHRLGGKRGGGFIFDTNTIHRGSPFGDHKRETIILEYHNNYKCPAIHSLGLNVPCPSGDQYMLARKI